MRNKFNELILIGMVAYLLLSGCNSITQNFGGTTTIDLEKGRKFITMSWKEGEAFGFPHAP